MELRLMLPNTRAPGAPRFAGSVMRREATPTRRRPREGRHRNGHRGPREPNWERTAEKIRVVYHPESTGNS
jgi:hypothetical protein